ncbi:MAG: OmpA family protein, partial [Acidimicrobiia bacterium]|nr:OmpA family protein [Acidimicrobiia bacterium]
VKLRGGGCQSGGDTGGLGALLLLLAGVFFLRKKRQRRLALLGLVGAMLVPAAANALSTRNLELGNFRPTIGNEADFITVDNTKVGDHLAWAAGVGFGFASKALIVESEETDMTDQPVRSRFATDIWASFAFMDRFEVGANIKLLSQQGDEPMFSSIEPADGFAVGDVHLYGKAHLLDAKPISLAAAGFFSIPTATDQEFAGAEGFSTGVRAIAAVNLGRIQLGANLGYRLRQNGRLADVVQGDEIAYGLGGSFLFAEDLQAIAEFIGAFGLEGDETGGISPLEGIVGVRYHLQPQWGLIAGAGRGLVSGIGAPAARGFLMLSFSPGRTARKVIRKEVIMVSALDPNKDEDDDGILNKDDECPQQAEDKDGFKDEDGCADLDNDGDGLMDKIDRCKMVPEDKDGHLDDDGCPDEDNDGDGIKDVDDKCPNEPEDKDGFKDDDGCDDFDNDRDGVPDLMDMCPKKKESINGIKDEDGCPDRGAAAVMVLNDQISVMEPIAFWGKSTRLKKRSANVIGQVAATLRAHPEFAKVGIEVHVHPRGPKDQKLSEDRGKAIKEQMTKRGVPADRLVIQAKGSSKPVRKSGKNAKKFNDRVTFPVLEVKEVP